MTDELHCETVGEVNAALAAGERRKIINDTHEQLVLRTVITHPAGRAGEVAVIIRSGGFRIHYPADDGEGNPIMMRAWVEVDRPDDPTSRRPKDSM